ncbi:hypothetical protein IWQ62_001574 [Dispira parvispora]|uniref:Uncharacterized protein n=1 Tax=Dispira parvispora TaxID=1520584 RepID=A0A9W8AXN4_9FUNG|nr:hypothetical protein IWQ62_001574 [Dispira parvispora]
MTFKLFSVVVLATLSTIVTAELPSDVKDCLNKCITEDRTDSCAADCIGTTVEVMGKLDKCDRNCYEENHGDGDAELVCEQACESDFDKESKYSYQDILAGIDEIHTGTSDAKNESSSSDKNGVESDTVQSSKTATESATKSTTKSSSTTSTNADDDDTADSDNGASTTASFMGSVGLSVAVIAYQFS